VNSEEGKPSPRRGQSPHLVKKSRHHGIFRDAFCYVCEKPKMLSGVRGALAAKHPFIIFLKKSQEFPRKPLTNLKILV